MRKIASSFVKRHRFLAEIGRVLDQLETIIQNILRDLAKISPLAMVGLGPTLQWIDILSNLFFCPEKISDVPF